MKQIYVLALVATFLVALFAMPLALAENETDSSTVVDSSVDEAVPSAFMQGWEKFKLNFVRNQTLKAEKELQLARWKIAEAKIAAKNGNVEKAEKAMEQHDAILARVQERIAKMDNKSLTPGLDQALQVHENRLANLNLVLQSSNLTDAQRAKIEERIAKLNNKTSQLEDLRVNISERRQERLDAFENRTARIEEAGNRVQEKMQERAERIASLKNSSDSDDDSEDDSSDDDSSEDDSSEDIDDDSDDSSNSNNSTNSSN